jgi:hypothetical protein
MHAHVAQGLAIQQHHCTDQIIVVDRRPRLQLLAGHSLIHLVVRHVDDRQQQVLARRHHAFAMWPETAIGAGQVPDRAFLAHIAYTAIRVEIGRAALGVGPAPPAGGPFGQ